MVCLLVFSTCVSFIILCIPFFSLSRHLVHWKYLVATLSLSLILSTSICCIVFFHVPDLSNPFVVSPFYPFITFESFVDIYIIYIHESVLRFLQKCLRTIKCRLKLLIGNSSF